MGAFAFDSANGSTLVLPWVSMPVLRSHGVVMTMMITVMTYFYGAIETMMITMMTMMWLATILLKLLMVPRFDDYHGGSNIEDEKFGALQCIGGPPSQPQLLIAFGLCVLAFNSCSYV